MCFVYIIIKPLQSNSFYISKNNANCYNSIRTIIIQWQKNSKILYLVHVTIFDSMAGGYFSVQDLFNIEFAFLSFLHAIGRWGKALFIYLTNLPFWLKYEMN